MENENNILEIIEQFKSLFNISINLFKTVPSDISEKDRLINDYEHKLEFKTMEHEEYLQTVLDLEKTMKDRRKSKDLLYIYEPLYKFITDDNNQEIINGFIEELDKIYNSTQQRIVNLLKREYRPRILDEEPFSSSSSIFKNISKYTDINLEYKHVKSDIEEEPDEAEDTE